MELKLPLSIALSFSLGFVTHLYLSNHGTESISNPVVIVEKPEIQAQSSEVQVTQVPEPTPPEEIAKLNQLKKLTSELEQIRLENDDLKRTSMEMAEKINHQASRTRELQTELRASRSEYAEAQRQLNLLEESEITDEQMRGLVAEPFSGFLTGFRGKDRDSLYEFFQQPEDLDWGYQMEVKIGDFIQTHPQQASVELVGVSCKISQCELRVIEKDTSENAYHNIFTQLQQQDWWQGVSTHSSSGNMPDSSGMKIFTYVKFRT